MVKDTSEYLSLFPQNISEPELSTLQTLGWQSFFAQQISVDELQDTPPVRVTEVHRSGFRVLGDGIDSTVPPSVDITVGDWLLLDPDPTAEQRVLDRKSLIKRRAPGHDRQVQLIAANIDTVFVVTSCNPDFNIARLERYIALAFEADVAPVILLTKADLCDDPAPYVADASSISDRVPVVLLDARGDTSAALLADWCKPGQTVAFLGSSGVGKSTLVNTLSGLKKAETKAIREDDARGRHTTTRRALHILPNGCAVLDTPGMRELQMTDAASGISDLFSDLQDLAEQCRFSDCQHLTEPKCAVRQAVEDGIVDAARFARWRKLTTEEQTNTASLAARKSRDKVLGKTIRAIKKNNRK